MIKYDKEKLNSVIRDFCVMTNVSVSVLDADFTMLADYSEKTPNFCREIQKFPQGHERCFCSDTALLNKCRESKRIESHICHAGILDAAMPIIRDDKIIGYILIGRMRVSEFDADKISWMKGDYESLKQMYYEMTKYNDKQIHSMLELAYMIVSFILTNNIITLELDDFSKKADEFIEKNLKEKLSVECLCKELNVSKNYLYDKFKASFGTTVNEYIIEKRLQKGKKLLQSTDYSINRIAEETGIGSYTYFSRLFKEKYGYPPFLFRKINKKI